MLRKPSIAALAAALTLPAAAAAQTPFQPMDVF